jgi:hypothetical protein
MSKMLSKRKGISTFIATLLLMVLAVSAGVVIYAYTMGYLGGFGGTEQLGAMSIDEASAVSDTPGNITCYVRNIGKTTIKLANTSDAQVYIDGEQATSWVAHGGGSLDIEEGAVQGVLITPASDLEAGKTYEVKIIASDNTQVSFSVKAD